MVCCDAERRGRDRNNGRTKPDSRAGLSVTDNHRTGLLPLSIMNPLDSPPVRAATLPGGGDPTGELGDVPDALVDSEHTPAPPAGRAAKIEFIGSVGEYARLWYVNRILSLLTLGHWCPVK